MILTRRLRSLMAGSRHGATAVAAVMLLVLAVVGAHKVCVHLTEHTGGVAQAHGGHGHGGEHSRGGGAMAVHAVATGRVDVVEPETDGSSGCADHDTVTAQAQPLLLPSSLVLAASPERTAIRLPRAAVYQDHRITSALARAAAPSLHALGIDRT
ncbi:hypothetical protein [Promicromonospora aerolata]|uniref:Secreted protein n=1 Tax=Promicromonospora aerolata TaxID=195749 RepID=A0ABW4V986_9MICO